MTDIYYYNSRPLAALLLAGSLLGVAKGMSIIRNDEWPLLGAACVVGFSGCFVAGLWLLLDRRPRRPLLPASPC